MAPTGSLFFPGADFLRSAADFCALRLNKSWSAVPVWLKRQAVASWDPDKHFLAMSLLYLACSTVSAWGLAVAVSSVGSISLRRGAWYDRIRFLTFETGSMVATPVSELETSSRTFRFSLTKLSSKSSELAEPKYCWQKNLLRSR